MTSTWFTDKQYADIVEFYDARITRDIVPFIQKDVLKDSSCSNKTFLDVGSGGGALTKELAPSFSRVDVIEPNRDHAESLKPFNVCHDPVQDAKIEAAHYDLIMCCHVFYHIPRELWETCLLKAFDGLKPGGSMVLTMSAPRGPWEELQASVRSKQDAPGENDSGALLKCIQDMKLPNKTTGTTADITATKDEFEMFHAVVRMFSWNQSQLEDCDTAERARVEIAIEEFAKKCFKPATDTYVLSQEEDNIVIQKPCAV